MKNKILVPILLLIFFCNSVTTFADEVELTLGQQEELVEYEVGDILYRKFTLNDGTKDHVIYNAELPVDGEFEVVLHDMLYGENAVGLATVMDIAKDYEERTGKVVYAATNGDYFSGGVPVDFYAVNNNILRVGPYSHTLGKNAFGFDNNGNSIIGKVQYGYKINIVNEEGDLIDEVHIDKINEPLNEGEIGLYTFNNTTTITGTNLAKMSIRFDKISGNYAFPYKGTLQGDINDFEFNDENYSVSYKDFVIVANGDSDRYQTLKNNVTSTSTITVYPYPTDDWVGMNYIIGGWQILLNKGTLLPEAIHDGGDSLASRTSIGIKADGTMGLIVTDGRMDTVPGIDLTDLATLNKELGYVTALELDGGGSSSFLLRNLQTDELEVMNQPSDGSLRKVANAVLIVGDRIDVPEPIDPDNPNNIALWYIVPVAIVFIGGIGIILKKKYFN